MVNAYDGVGVEMHDASDGPKMLVRLAKLLHKCLVRHVGRENSPMPEPRLEQKNNYEIHVSCQEDSRRAIEECVSNFRTTHFLLMHLILHVESLAHGLSTLPRFSISSSKREETTPPHPSRLPLRQGI